MKVETTSPALGNQLALPAAWADEVGMHEQFTWLRNNDPLRRIDPQGYEPF